MGTLNFDYNCVSESFTQDKINTMLGLAHNLGIDTIDSAYYYGNAEKYLGQCDSISLFKVNSKANPWYKNDFKNGKYGFLNKEGVYHQLNGTLKALGIDTLNTYFMHAWDYDTPIIETLEAFDDWYRKEKFRNFGVSNISLQQLTSILNICESSNYNITPTVYQGLYNIYCRNIEELFPILDDYSIDFQCYNPLAGGLLTGKYWNSNVEKGRFIENSIYQSIYWNEQVVSNTQHINADLALRWLSKYSKLRTTDSIIIGCSSTKHLIDNVNSILNNETLGFHDLNRVNKFYNSSNRFQPNYFY